MIKKNILIALSLFTSWSLSAQTYFGEQDVLFQFDEYSSSFSTCDIDGDGDIDFLVVPRADDTLAWYENTDGNGTIGEPHIISDTANGSFKACDMDGDGDQDVLAASSNGMAWYENSDGEGTFGEPQIIPGFAGSVYAYDIDGDGDLDILKSSDYKLAWNENTDGEGTFGEQQIIPGFAGKIYVCDIDGDGDPDVLKDGGYQLAWNENTDGNGTFGDEQLIDMPYIYSIIPCDMDGDGDLDILLATGGYRTTQQPDYITWYKNTDGNGAFSKQQNIITYTTYSVGSICVSDIDGDGDLDVLYSRSGHFGGNGLWDGSYEIAWYENTDGNGTFGSAQNILGGWVESHYADPFCLLSILPYDIDGDGDQDVLSATSFNDKIAWYLNTDGHGTFDGKQVIVGSADFPRSAWTCDINGDGDQDVLSVSSLSKTIIAWYKNFSIEIITQPANDTICSESDAAFSLTATGAETYRWQVDEGTGFADLSDNSVYSGVTSPTLTISNASAAMDGYIYRCVLNPAGTIFSDGAVLTCDTISPEITSNYNDLMVGNGVVCDVLLPDYTGDVTATDNCDMELDVTQNPIAGTILSGQTNTVTLTVTDKMGNTDEVTFNVAVADNTSPEITSTHGNLILDAGSDCEAIVADYTVSVTATDNCDADLDVTQNPAAGTTLSGQTNNVTLTVTDEMGNTAEVTFNVAVVDNASPEITSTHTNLVVDAGSDCEAIVADYTVSVTATDNCDADLTVTQNPAAGTSISGATNAISLTVTNDAGNSDEVIFNIIVEDYTTPTISCAGNQTVVAGETHYYTVSGAEFDPAETGDYCGVAGVENDFTNTATLAGAQIPEGTTTITWTSTDIAGNENTCSVDITVTAYTVGVEKPQQNGISIYPNPVRDELFIQVNTEMELPYTIKIFAQDGRLILTKEVNERGIQSVPMGDVFDPGYYLVRVQSDTFIGTGSFVAE